MIREKALALMLGLSLSAAAQESPATADFTAGFQRLVALGLPELKGAEWVAAGDSGEPDYSLREIYQDLKGNGWKIQQGEKPMFLPLGQLDPQEMPATSGSRRGLIGSLLGGGGSTKAKTVDPIKDADKLIATLGDPVKSKDLRDRLEYTGTSSLGGLLIHATQLHQTGHTKEANQLAATVFSLGASPESVIDAAIDRLAARDLKRVTEAFFTSHDWAAYERDLRALTERYPRGWENFPAVQMLLPAVAKRVAGAMPPKPTIPGVNLHPDAIAALDDALRDEKKTTDEDAVASYAKQNGIPAEALTPSMRQQIVHMMLSRGDGDYSSGSWLIEEPPDAESKDPWSRLKRLGLDALPALAAVASDETLTYSRNPSSGGYSSYRSSQESAADRALKAYQSMDRPQTRGELACSLLTATMPGENDSESSPQMIAEAAMEFWKNHRGKSKLDLLLVFLAEGSSYQKSTASNTLAKMPEDAAHQAFEQYILENEDITSKLDSVSTYLKLRKAAAKDFFTRFSTTLKTQLDGVDLDRISGGHEIKQAGGVDKYLKKLSLIVGGESPRKLVLELAKAEKPDTRQIHSLAATVAESSPNDFVPLYLEAAVSATQVETRAAFLTAINRQTYRRQRESGEDAEITKDTPVPAAQIPNWTTLLKDERPTADGEKIRDYAASVMEGLHCSAAGQEYAFEIYQVDPAAYDQLILTRANDRVAGKSPSPLPDADKVSPARLDEMLKQLAAAQPDAVHNLAQSWPIEDRLAFKKWGSDPEHAAKIPASVIAARKLLNAPIESPDGPTVAESTEILQSLDLKPGSKIDYDLITKLAGTLALAAKKHSGLAATFASSPLDTGFAVQAVRTIDSQKKRVLFASFRFLPAFTNSDDDAVVEIGWIADHEWVQALWKIKGSTVTPPEKEHLEKLRETMAARDQPDAKPLQLIISVLHRDDLEKLKKLSQSGYDEESESPEE